MAKGQIIGTVECSFCKHEIRVKADKNENPYMYCDYCGVRTQFVGYEEGLRELKKRLKKISAPAEEKPERISEPAASTSIGPAKKKGSLLPWGS